MIDDIRITSTNQLQDMIREKRLTRQTHVTIQFANPTWSAMSGEGLPTLQFDQLNVIAHHLNAMINKDDGTWNDLTQWPPVTNNMIIAAVRKGIALPNLTRKRLLDSPNWPKFKSSDGLN
jgi:hypothetical protein